MVWQTAHKEIPGRWCNIPFKAGHNAAGSPHSSASPTTSPESGLGVRRALMESMLRLSCRDSVLADASISLGPVPDEHAHAYCLTTELYGNTRMLLACLTEAELAKVMLC